MSDLPATQPKPMDLVIVDRRDGSLLPLEDLNILPKTEDAYPMIPALENLVRDAKIMLARLQMIVQDDLKERNATERFVGGRKYQLKTDSNWRVDNALFKQLQVLSDAGEIAEADFKKAVEVVVGATEYHWDNGVLNRLSELGGDVAAAIKNHRISDPKTSVRVK